MQRVTWAQRVGVIACLLLLSHTASAGLFDDEEARRAILDLRQRIDALKTDRAELDRKLLEDAQRTGEETAQLKRSILDLQNQLEGNRAELAKLRGQIEQLARDVSEIQRRQHDVSNTLEDRLRKLEPITVSVDGREFQADPTEKRDFETNLAVFPQRRLCRSHHRLCRFSGALSPNWLPPFGAVSGSAMRNTPARTAKVPLSISAV